ncbi:hypothetical protein TNCV_4498771 [Trichonephila clavipes]|nr:hypothetical protein TNCV_4498771 [Trichonephila clavipes]
MAPSLDTLFTASENGLIPALDDPQLVFYRRRLIRFAGILKFQQLLKQFPIPIKLVQREYGFHLSGCVWSVDECKEGPDTYNCFDLFDEPEEYFIVKELNHMTLRDGSCHRRNCLKELRCQCNDLGKFKYRSSRMFLQELNKV